MVCREKERVLVQALRSCQASAGKKVPRGVRHAPEAALPIRVQSLAIGFAMSEKLRRCHPRKESKTASFSRQVFLYSRAATVSEIFQARFSKPSSTAGMMAINQGRFVMKIFALVLPSSFAN